MRGRDKLQKLKPLISFLTIIMKVFPMCFRKYLLVFFRDTKGLKGLFIRYILLKVIAVKCGDNVSIHSNTFILSPEKLSVGNNVSVHPMCYIDASGGLTIHNDVSIAHHVTIMTTEHNYDDITIPIKDQGLIQKPVVINDNIWIGAKATVLAGNCIGSGSIIAASAVVTKNIDDNSIVAGVPAKIVKKRS